MTLRPVPTSPSHENASKPGASQSGDGAEADGSERRRLPRISLTAEQFRHAGLGKVFSVMDLSSGGMALRVLDREDLAVFPIGAEVRGTINIRGAKHGVVARVRHLRTDLIGCEFENPSADLRMALQSQLDPAILGAELRPLPVTEGTATTSFGATLWYHGPSGTDLILSGGGGGHAGEYQRFALYVLGTFIQWDEATGLSTGRAQASASHSEQRGIVLVETLVLEPDARPDTGKLSIAKTLLMGSNLPQDLRKWCLRQLESSS